ncbi:MAG: ribonuclease P protein component [Candidatus Kapabacteria bacterium]|nr:ribonuclease P protein component [Candidatus Kapabacteria bacterium]
MKIRSLKGSTTFQQLSMNGRKVRHQSLLLIAEKVEGSQTVEFGISVKKKVPAEPFYVIE